MIGLIFLFVFSIFVWADDMPVNSSLANMVEEVVVKAKVKSINIPPGQMTSTSVNINQINGVSVCDSSIKDEVEGMAKLFSQHPNAHSVISTYGAYVRKDKNIISYLPAEDPRFKKMAGECSNLFVSVR